MSRGIDLMCAGSMSRNSSSCACAGLTAANHTVKTRTVPYFEISISHRELNTNATSQPIFIQSLGTSASGQNPFHHHSMNVGQPEVPAGVAEGKPLVVQAHEVQECGVQVVDVDAAVFGVGAELVSDAVEVPALHPAARQPHGE